MTNIGTEYWLDDVPLAYTRIKWPMMYRGTNFIPVVFYQPTELYDQLKDLPRNEAGVTLKIVCNGKDGAYEENIEGVQIVKVEKLTARDEVDGCRVTIADRRWRLQNEIMQQSWGLLFQGQYLQGTAKSKTKAYRLDTALQENLIGQYPFSGYMRDDWDVAIKPRGEFNYLVPNDLLYAGQPMVPTLQKLLEWWGIDLVVDTKGKFYLATRLSGITGDDDGTEIVKANYDEWEWVETEPEIDTKRKFAGIPKKIKIPFWERHALQVPYGNLVDAATPTTGGSSSGDVPKPKHELVLKQAYKAAGRFFSYKKLQDAFGVSLTDKPRTFFMSPTQLGTKIWHGDADLTDIEIGKRFTLTQIIAESERKYYSISHSEDPNKKIAWTEFALGVCGGDGVQQPRDAIGDWTELYEKLAPLVGIVNGSKIITNEPIARVYTFLDKYDAIGNLNDTFEELVDDKVISLADLGIGRPDWENKRALGEAAPFNVLWAAKDIGVIQLSLDKRRAKPGSDAVIGTPESIPQVGTKLPANKKHKAQYDKKYKALNLRIHNMRDDMVFPTDYSFWVYVTATRNAPNDKGKFWVEEVAGDPDGDIEELWLDADQRYHAFRDFVNLSPAPSLASHTPEKKRPNGNDGFGKILNRGQIKRRARARAELVLMRLLEPEAWTHKFLNFPLVSQVGRMAGAIDSIVLDINEKVVMCELAMGTRADDAARREEATMRAIRQVQEFAGKKLER